MGQEENRKEIVEEYLRGGVSLRGLSRKYGVTITSLHRWVKAHQSGQEIGSRRPQALVEMPKDVRRLQRELYEARLEAKLYKTMVEVAERDLGIPIRKKIWGQVVTIVRESEEASQQTLCRLLGRSRQGYYKLQRREEREAIKAELVIREVVGIRSIQK